MPGGRRGAAFAIIACTSWAAASIERSRLNWIVICVRPSALDEVIESMPAIVVNCFSSGVATAEAIVSGLAPGSEAETWIVGKSMFGRSLTGRSRKPMIPKSTRLDTSHGYISYAAFCLSKTIQNVDGWVHLA